MSYTRSNTATTAPHSTNAAQPSPYQQRTTQRDNPTQRLIKQAVDYLLQQLEAGKSETLTAYLAPMVGHRRNRNDADRDQTQDASTKPTPVLIGFRAVYVFDVAQTEGADLPVFEHSITGEVGEHRDRLIAFLNTQNIALEYSENIAPALGVSYGGKIAILPGQSPAEDLVCLVHETAHELLHKSTRRTMTTATVRETEAEAVAFIVGQAIGLEMGKTSSDYIQMYAGNAALLAESLEVIQQTSAVILDAITGESASTQNAPVTSEAQDAIAEVA
jgi:hypothetical protein